jgi:peptidoglycan/LPS O-acetylase OafA/YrhL
MLEAIFYIIFCLLTGLCGIHRRMGFFVTFLAALVFTPVIVLLLLLMTGPSHRVEWQRPPQSN